MHTAAFLQVSFGGNSFKACGQDPRRVENIPQRRMTERHCQQSYNVFQLLIKETRIYLAVSSGTLCCLIKHDINGRMGKCDLFQ